MTDQKHIIEVTVPKKILVMGTWEQLLDWRNSNQEIVINVQPISSEGHEDEPFPFSRVSSGRIDIDLTPDQEITEEVFSNCCGANSDNPAWEVQEVCPRCGEHCIFE